MRYLFRLIEMAVIKKEKKKKKCSWEAGGRKLSQAAGGDVTCVTAVGTVFPKVKQSYHMTQISLGDTDSTELEAGTLTAIWIPTFTAASFTKAKRQEQAQCPLMDE